MKLIVLTEALSDVISTSNNAIRENMTTEAADSMWRETAKPNWRCVNLKNTVKGNLENEMKEK